MEAAPRREGVGKVADWLFRLRAGLNPSSAPGHLRPPFRPGDLLLGKSPEFYDDLSYGFPQTVQKAPGVGDLLPTLRESKKEQVLDAALSAPIATPAKGGSLLIGAMKPKGGAWLPSTREILAEAIAGRRLVPEADLRAAEVEGATDSTPFVQARRTEFQRMVDNWLNRYAGTEGDPIKDIAWQGWGPRGPEPEAPPFTLENITDEAFIGRPPNDWAPYIGDEHITGSIGRDVSFLDVAEAKAPGAPVYGLFGEGGAGEQDIWDFFSHVGDTLANVPQAELKNWDLIRAVRETVRRDAEQAKKMLKAQGSLEGTVPFKKYPDGFQWVEVRSPEALEMEGNVMGHCVGGYCEDVERGVSKIYSLRDPKGNSHVTVEVGPKWDHTRLNPEEQKTLFKIMHTKQPQSAEEMVEELREAGIPKPERVLSGIITQIKGKQNRAPVDAYIPYVQDFVRGGNWADAYDLQNAGLWKVGKEFLTKEELAERVKAKGLTGPIPVENFSGDELVRYLSGRDRPLAE